MVTCMTFVKVFPAVIAAAALTLGAAAADAGQHGGRGPAAGHAVPRPGGVGPGARPVVVTPRIVGVVPYRPYYYPFRPGLTVGFYAGVYPYGYYPWGYGYYNPYGYPLPPPAFVSAQPGVAYGGVRIEGAPKDAQVFADGYYVGIVDDFDGVFQHLNLVAGPHRIEIRDPNYPAIAFDVRVEPGETVTYHAGL